MGREEVVIWAGRGLLYAGKPTCRNAAPSKIELFYSSLEFIDSWSTHFLMPSYSNSMKKWSVGLFGPPSLE